MDKKFQILASESQAPDLNQSKHITKQIFFDKCIGEYIKKSKEKFWSVKVFCLVLFSGFYHSLDEGKRDSIRQKYGNTQTTEKLYDFLLVNIKEIAQQKENDVFFLSLKQAFLSYLSIFKSEYNKMEGIDKCKEILDYLDSFVNNDSKTVEVNENEKSKPEITDNPHVDQSKADVDLDLPNSINSEQRIEETKNENKTDSTIRSETDEITCIVLKIINVVLDLCNANDENIDETLKIEFYSLINNQLKCEDNKICGSLRSILQTFNNGVVKYTSLEAKQTISKSRLRRRNAPIVINMIDQREMSFQDYTEYTNNIFQFLMDLEEEPDLMRNEAIKDLSSAISEKVKKSKSKNTKIYKAWLDLLGKTECNLGKNLLQRKITRPGSQPKIQEFKTNCIVENMNDVLFLFYDIYRFGMKAGLLSEDDDTKRGHSNTKLMESFKKVYLSFEEKILPILMCYYKKGDGKICNIDIANVRNFFLNMLENYEEPQSIYQSSFRYALNSASDTFKSLEFKENLLKRNFNSNFQEFFEFYEHFEVEYDTIESNEDNIAGVELKKSGDEL